MTSLGGGAYAPNAPPCLRAWVLGPTRVHSPYPNVNPSYIIHLLQAVPSVCPHYNKYVRAMGELSARVQTTFSGRVFT